MTDPNLENMKAELRARSDADPLGFRRAAAWDAIFSSSDLRALRARLSADDIKRLVGVIVPAAVQAHDWFTYGRLNWKCCRVCGIVRRADGKNSPCKGPVAVGPRSPHEPHPHEEQS